MARPPRFDARWNRRRRLRATWRAWRWRIALAAMLGAGWWIARQPVPGGDWQAASGTFPVCGERRSASCVIDGDTIAIGDRRIRLTGYDAPELDGSCEAERRLALRAQAALSDWLARGPFLLDGGAEPPRDAYGRELRAARRDDAAGQQWLAETMIAQGLARDGGWLGAEDTWCG